jgi:hypothetical protein
VPRVLLPASLSQSMLRSFIRLQTRLEVSREYSQFAGIDDTRANTFRVSPVT